MDGRSSGLLFNILQRRFFSLSDISGGNRVLLFLILLNISISCFPTKGFLPTAKIYKATPNDQMSAFFGSVHLLDITSGAIYEVVPQNRFIYFASLWAV